MNIAIDIDDTLTELFDEKVKRCTDFFTKKNWAYQLVRTDTSRVEEMFQMTKSDAKELWFGISDALMKEISPRPQAVEVIKRLKQYGHNIYIVTARSTDWHKDPYGMSVGWLKKHNIPFDELFIAQENKSIICREKHIDLFVDDLVDNIAPVQSIGIQTILIETKHSANINIPEKTILCKNWNEIENYILNYQKK